MTNIPGLRLGLAVAVAMAAGTGPAAAEQAGRSGQPLADFCNTAPELSVQRSDSVDNWVRICTVWFNARCRDTDPPRVPDAPKTKESQPATPR